MDIVIRHALPSDAAVIAAGVKELTDEIMARTGAPHFVVDAVQIENDCRNFLKSERYAVYLAEGAGAQCAGFATLCESRALYAGGSFGIIQEFYVAPQFRSAGLGRRLLDVIAAHGGRLGWKRLEMCTPPLPEFDRTLEFYRRNGFEITGGRKMKRLL
ncbi:MAG: N-acetyltransferase [Betaproteobacteria bacterium]|nr:MAG: N-acetyltransferase [Betaproteobacteria bacterium]